MKLYLDEQGQPRSSGEALRLPPKETKVLGLLIAASPEAVSHRSLIEEAWPESGASLDSLARAVMVIRRRIPGVSLDSIYGRGYRLGNTVLDPDPRIQSAARAPSASLDTYLYARNLLAGSTERSVSFAIAALESLLSKDAGYASAHVLLATAIAADLAWGRSHASSLTARDALDHLNEAERLDPEVPGLESTRAWLAALSWRFDESAPLFRRALLRTPCDSFALLQYGWHLLACGDPRGAQTQFLRARELQPCSSLAGAFLAYSYQVQGRLDDAYKCAAEAAAFHPPNALSEFLFLMIRSWQRVTPTVLAESRELFQSRDQRTMFGAGLAYALAQLGQIGEAHHIVDSQLSRMHQYAAEHLPIIFALMELGRTDEAAGVLQRAFDHRCAILPIVLLNPAVAPLLRHPAIAKIHSSLESRRLR